MPITLFQAPERCVSEFLGFVNKALTPDFQADEWTKEVVPVVDRLSIFVERFIEDDQLGNVSNEYKAAAVELEARFVYFGLLTHCLCFDSEHRHKVAKLDMDPSFYLEWLEKSIVARQYLSGAYNRDTEEMPSLIFGALHVKELEPFMKEIGLGMWKRAKNKGIFQNFFGAGIALGVMSYIRMTKLPD